MDSLQSRNQVDDKRAEPDEKRAGKSTLVRRKSDHPVEFAVHLDDPNEEITEQWQDGLHEWYIRRDDQCSVKPNRIPRDVSEMRSSQSLCPCLKRRSVSVSTNSKVSTPRERDSHSASREPFAVLPQKPSVVAWFQRCFRVPHLFGLPSPRKVDSSNRTHIPTISGIAANGSGVVDKIAKTARVICLYVLMVGATSCLDQAVHAFPVADAIPISCPCVEIFHVDPRDNVEQRVRQNNLMNRMDMVQLGGQLPSCKDPYTDVRRRGGKTRHVRQNQLDKVSDRTRWRARLEESWRPTTLALIVQDKKSQSLLAYVADLTRDQHRRGGRVFLTFPWNWNVLTTWPIQSMLDEAPFLFAREGKRGILTNCVDTARLVGRSRCCKSLMSQRLVQSSLANMVVSHEVYLWNVSIQEDSVYSCYPLDDEEATAFPSEADEAMREWRQEFPEQTRRAIIRIHTNLGHPQIRHSQR